MRTLVLLLVLANLSFFAYTRLDATRDGEAMRIAESMESDGVDRELAADRAGAYLTMKPQALASALQKITGEMNQIPDRDLRQVSAASALCIAPAVRGVSLRTLTSTHPTLEQRLEQLAKIQAELGRPTG